MDKARGFYPHDPGSTPGRRTNRLIMETDAS